MSQWPVRNLYTEVDVSPELERNKAPYAQIADHFRRLISNGELVEGDRIPPVTQIAQDWGVAGGTANRAIKQLRGEKLVTSNNQGTFVTATRATPTPGDLVSRVSESPDQIKVTAAETVTARAYVGDLLGLDAEAGNLRVIRREAVTYRNDKPITLSVSWFPAPLGGEVPELLENEAIPSTLRLIGERTGQTEFDAETHVSSRPADEREAEHLEVTAGDAILAGAMIYRNTDGDAVEYREFVSPAEHTISQKIRLSL